jgi:hypothetical protein
MSLVIEAHKSLINAGLHKACNAFICHLPTDIHGQDKVQKYVERAQVRLEHRMSLSLSQYEYKYKYRSGLTNF